MSASFEASPDHVDGGWTAAFMRDGYAVLPGLAPPDLVAAAIEAITADLTHSFEPARQAEYENQSYCPALRQAPVVHALLACPALIDKVDALLDYAKLIVGPAQIAIRKARQAKMPAPPEPHIDGVATPTNGLAGNELHTFTLLVGVFLVPKRRGPPCQLLALHGSVRLSD